MPCYSFRNSGNPLHHTKAIKYKTLAGFLRNHPQSDGRIKSWLNREKELGQTPLSEFMADFDPDRLVRFPGIAYKTRDKIVSIFEAEKLIPYDHSEIENFPARLKNVLIREKLTTRETVRNAISQGRLYPKRTHGYALKSHKMLCAWTQAENLEIENLPGRIKNILLSEGLITRDAVKKAIHSGGLLPNKNRHYGQESHRLLCWWIMVG